jgi:putative thioredoxin
MLILDGMNKPSRNQSFIKDVNMSNFALEVIQASEDKIVLVDFWAPWCGPCKQLTPTLEKAAEKHQSQIILAKINIDQNPELAAQLRVQTIPTVYAFFKGQPIDAFMGNLSEQKLDQFLKKLIELTGLENNINLDEVLKQAQDAFDEANYETSAELYANILSQIDEQESAIAGLAHCYLLLRSPEKTTQIVSQIPLDKRQTRQALALLSHIDLLNDIKNLQQIPTNDSLAKSYQTALKNFEEGEIEQAIQELLEVNRLDIKWNNGAAKDILLRIFASLGHNHNLTHEGRRKLSAMLFS